VAGQFLDGIARHVIGCQSSQDTRVQSALDDVANKICQALVLGEVDVKYDSLLRIRYSPGRGAIENEHSTEAKSTNRVRASVCKLCSNIGSSARSERPY